MAAYAHLPVADPENFLTGFLANHTHYDTPTKKITDTKNALN